MRESMPRSASAEEGLIWAVSRPERFAIISLSFVVIGVGVGSVEGVELVVVVFVVMGRLFRGVCVPFDMRWS